MLVFQALEVSNVVLSAFKRAMKPPGVSPPLGFVRFLTWTASVFAPLWRRLVTSSWIAFCQAFSSASRVAFVSITCVPLT